VEGDDHDSGLHGAVLVEPRIPVLEVGELMGAFGDVAKGGLALQLLQRQAAHPFVPLLRRAHCVVPFQGTRHLHIPLAALVALTALVALARLQTIVLGSVESWVPALLPERRLVVKRWVVGDIVFWGLGLLDFAVSSSHECGW